MSKFPEQYRPGLPEGQNNLSYPEYQAFGGCLNEDSFNHAFEFLNNGQLPIRGRENYYLSCRHYAELAGFSPGLSQERLYAYLRTMMPPSDNQRKNEGNNYPWQLGDQALLAEVFLLTEDVASYQQFTAFFPNIFGRKNGGK